VQNQILVVEPGGHCAGGAISWPNSSWGWDLTNTYQLDLFESTIGAPASVAATRVADEATLLRALRASQRALKGLAVDEPDAAPLRVVRGSLSRWGTAPAPLTIWYVLGPGLPGSLGNLWASAPAWPATNATRLFLRAGGELQLVPAPSQEDPSTWTHDPASPIPTFGGNNLIISPCGPQDQSTVEADFASSMTTFATAPLEATLVINGMITAELWVTSSALDMDVNVKLSDVFPDGVSMLIQDGVVRMRWRNGTTATEPSLLTPGVVYPVTVDVGWMSYIVNAGHAIRVAISSSNSPRFSVNPGTGLPLWPGNTTAPIVATNAVLHNADHPSALVLPLLDPEALQRLLL
jgi:hypothetical protein